MKYKLLAADMDATALNSKKELTPANVNAMEKAIAQGKTVVFSTGRSISLVKPYIDMVRGMRYAVTGSGASVIDTQTGKKFLYETIDPETVKYIAARAAGYVMPIFFIDEKHIEFIRSKHQKQGAKCGVSLVTNRKPPSLYTVKCPLTICSG